MRAAILTIPLLVLMACGGPTKPTPVPVPCSCPEREPEPDQQPNVFHS